MGIKHYENFPVGSVLLPRRLRQPIGVIYAFARTADDFADEGSALPEERLRRLEQYRHQLDLIAENVAPTLPLFVDLSQIIREVKRALWEAVEASPSAADYQIYLQQYPNGIYAALAQTRLAEAEREAAAIEADRVFWQSVENSTSIADFEAYLKKYPDGEFADLARNRIDSLKETQTAAIVTPTLDVPSTKSMPPSDDDVEPRITLYDGTWSVAMHTSVGRCRPVYRYKITVRSGEISGYLTGRAGKYIVSGTVARDGSFKSLIAGGDYVNANGKLKGNSGKGTWRSQSGCEGTSEFERIGEIAATAPGEATETALLAPPAEQMTADDVRQQLSESDKIQNLIIDYYRKSDIRERVHDVTSMGMETKIISIKRIHVSGIADRIATLDLDYQWLSDNWNYEYRGSASGIRVSRQPCHCMVAICP